MTDACVQADELVSELTDDQITALVDDPAKIETHEIALEVLAVLDAEIADIQSQVDAAIIEANARPLPPDRQAWLRRATYAGAMRRNERHKIFQRDKELRGTKNKGHTPKDPLKAEANKIKQERLREEATVRRKNKELEIEKQRTAQMQIAVQRRELDATKQFQHRFQEAAMRLLPPETYEMIKTAVK